jgi:hypothetical protein
MQVNSQNPGQLLPLARAGMGKCSSAALRMSFMLEAKPGTTVVAARRMAEICWHVRCGIWGRLYNGRLKAEVASMVLVGMWRILRRKARSLRYTSSGRIMSCPT